MIVSNGGYSEKMGDFRGGAAGGEMVKCRKMPKMGLEGE